MLVITRKVEEKVTLINADGTTTTLTVFRAACGKVRLGIEAPPSVRIMRTDLLERIAAQQAADAAQSSQAVA